MGARATEKIRLALQTMSFPTPPRTRSRSRSLTQLPQLPQPSTPVVKTPCAVPPMPDMQAKLALARLADDNATLAFDNAQLMQQLATAAKEHSAFLGQSQKDLEAMEAMAQRAECDSSSLQKELDELQEKLDEAESSHERATMAAHAKCDELQEKLDEAESSRELAITAAHAECDELQEELDELQEKLDEAELSDKLRTATTWKQHDMQLLELENEVELANEQNHQLAATLRKCVAERDDLQEEAESFGEAMFVAAQERLEMEQAAELINMLQMQIRDQSEQDALKKASDQHPSSPPLKFVTIKRLEKENDDREAIIRELTANDNALSQEIVSLNEQIQYLGTQHTKLGDEHHVLGRKHAPLRERNETLVENAKALDERNERSMATAARNLMQQQEYTDLFEVLNLELVDTQESAAAQKQKDKECMNELEAKSGVITHTIQQLTDQVRQHAHNVVELTQRNATLEEQNQVFKQENASLRENLAYADNLAKAEQAKALRLPPTGLELHMGSEYRTAETDTAADRAALEKGILVSLEPTMASLPECDEPRRSPRSVAVGTAPDRSPPSVAVETAPSRPPSNCRQQDRWETDTQEDRTALEKGSLASFEPTMASLPECDEPRRPPRSVAVETPSRFAPMLAMIKKQMEELNR